MKNQMDRLSDYVLTILIHRCNRVGYLTSGLKNKSYGLRRYTVFSPSWSGECTDKLLTNTITHIRLVPPYNKMPWDTLSKCIALSTLDISNVDIHISDLELNKIPKSLTRLIGSMDMPYMDCRRVLRSKLELLPCPVNIRTNLVECGPDGVKLTSAVLNSGGVIITGLRIPTSNHLRSLEVLLDGSIAHDIPRGLLFYFTLTSLCIDDRLTSEWVVFINKLPVISTLRVSVQSSVLSELYELRAPLTSLSIAISMKEGSKGVILCVDQLPSTVTDLEAMCSDQSSIDGMAHSNLKRLRTNMRISDDLPSSLLCLEASAATSNRWRIPAHIQKCIHLTDLTYTPEPGIYSTALSWPDSITRLILRKPNSLIVQLPVRLPRQLKYLRICLPSRTTAMEKWTLTNVREVHTDCMLTDKQLTGFRGSKLIQCGKVLVDKN